MNEKWISIDKTSNKVTVTVKLPLFDRFSNPNKVKLKTSQVIEFLKSKKLNILKCIQDPGIIRNTVKGENIKTWIFELQQTKVNKKVSKIKTEKKVEKSLDKSPESVIIVEEKKESPTTIQKDENLTEE